MSARYLVKPHASRDLDDYASHLGDKANLDVALRFLDRAHTMLILYRPLAEGVEILRVVHGSRNLNALLRREGLE